MEKSLRKHIVETDKKAKEKFKIFMKQILEKNPIVEKYQSFRMGLDL